MALDNDTSRVLGQLQAGVEGLENALNQFRTEYREDFAKLVTEVRDRHHRHNNEMQGTFGSLERRVGAVEKKVARSEGLAAGASRASSSWSAAIIAFASALLTGLTTYIADHWK